MSKITIVIFLLHLSILFASNIYARQIIESDGLRATVDQNFSCAESVSVNIDTADATVFHGDRLKLQELLGGTRAVLSFECNNNIKRINVVGRIHGKPAYHAYIQEQNNWRLVDDINQAGSSGNNSSSYESVVTECDRLAADPYDQNKTPNIYGVPDAKVNIDIALDACISAVANDQNSARYNFQLGRVLFLSQMYSEATEYLETAKRLSKYPAATYYLAMAMLQYENAPVNEILATLEAIAFEFPPAANFVEEYKQTLAAEQAEIISSKMNENFIYLDRDITDKSYKYDNVFNSFVSSELLDLTDHSILAASGEIIISELQGWCPNLVSKSDARRIAEYIAASPNSKGYMQYIRETTVNLSKHPIMNMFGMTQQRQDSISEAHMNDAFRNNDETRYEFSSDVGKLMKYYDCHEKEIVALANNIMNFVETAPPYNTAAQSYWDSCMSSSLDYPVSKNYFCGCFLNEMRGGNISSMGSDGARVIQGLFTGALASSYAGKKRYASHKVGHDLLRDFSSTARKLINKYPELSNECTKQKDNSFKRFMEGEIDSYGRPNRRGY